MPLFNANRSVGGAIAARAGAPGRRVHHDDHRACAVRSGHGAATRIAATHAARRRPAETRTIDIMALLPLLWAAGAALLLLRLAAGTLRVAVWTRRARAVDDGSWLALVQRLAARLGITRPITLLRSERACVPMTWGVVYPTVLLPTDADEWTAERRTIVLLHELGAHVKRLDAFTQLVAQVATGVYWFNPLVWLAARQMRTEREHACDDFVLEGGARASDYAHDLAEQIARSLGGSSAPRRPRSRWRVAASSRDVCSRFSIRRPIAAASRAPASPSRRLACIALALPLAALAPAQSVSAAIRRSSRPRVVTGPRRRHAWSNSPIPSAPHAQVAREQARRQASSYRRPTLRRSFRVRSEHGAARASMLLGDAAFAIYARSRGIDDPRDSRRPRPATRPALRGAPHARPDRETLIAVPVRPGR